MKKIILLLLLTSIASAQGIRFGDSKQSNIGVIIDPYASYKEKGINIGIEIDYRENGLYIHTGIQNFSAIKGGYTEWITAGGANLNIGYFDNLRVYAGPRLGLISRGGSIYPTAGIESGTDYVFENGFIIGFRATYDYRSDFEYWGGKAEMRPSGFIKIGFKL